jgi:putative membrane protein
MSWPATIGLAAAAVSYLFMVRRLAQRGVRWSLWRTAAYAGGLGALAVALTSPLATHDEDIRVHMLQHLLLGMLAPLLLALSAPATLLLRALPAPRRAPVVRVLHSRLSRVVVHPFTGTALAVGSLYVLYFTPLYAATLRSEPLHKMMHVHMVITGCLLAWSLVGLDPMPHRQAFRLRACALIGAMAGHTVVAKLVYANAGSLASGHGTQDAWRQGGQLLFYGGDIIDLALLTAFFAQWYALEGRRAEREEHRLGAATSGAPRHIVRCAEGRHSSVRSLRRRP